MSTINNIRLEAYEKAFWWFAQQGYLTGECEFYAKQFEVYRLENLDVNLEDSLTSFVGDVVFAEKAEKDKEGTLYA
jgi:hypothetical protein